MDIYLIVFLLFRARHPRVSKADSTIHFVDPCAIGCTVPFNEGCRVVNNTAQCICPTCRNIVLPVCATDGVQDQSDCHMRRQACRGDIGVTVAKQGACGEFNTF